MSLIGVVSRKCSAISMHALRGQLAAHAIKSYGLKDFDSAFNYLGGLP